MVVAEKAQPAALTGNLGNYLLSLAAKAQKKLSKKKIQQISKSTASRYLIGPNLQFDMISHY